MSIRVLKLPLAFQLYFKPTSCRRHVPFSRLMSTTRSNFVYNRKQNPDTILSETLFIFSIFALSVPLLLLDSASAVRSPYGPLGPGDSFRILILEPGSSRDPLKCHLKPVSSFQEEYDALSYTWSEQHSSVDVMIVCNGLLCWIKPNLAAALRRLRSPTEERALWVDKICVNQDDLQERGTQVLIMRDIYANARQVMIWLGEEADCDKSALSLLNWLPAQFDQIDESIENEKDEESVTIKWAQIKLEQSDNFEHLAALLNREWFNRTWVVQEVASAQKAFFMYGHQLISWEVVSDVSTRLLDPLFRVNLMETDGTRHSQENIFAMENARRAVNGTSSLSLFEILLATCFNECTDPRDKIFAVLGLAKDWLEKRGLAPDYRQTTTVEEVFKRFAMWDIKTNDKIRILSCVTGHGPLLNLPSWAPDWRKIENANPFVRYSERTMFSASRNTSVDAWYSGHGQVLNTIGGVVDSIEVIGSKPRYCRVATPFAKSSIEQLKDTQAWIQECHDLAANSNTNFNGGMKKPRYEQFWRTMTCGLTANGFPAPTEYGSYFMNYLEFIKSAVQELNATTEQSGIEKPHSAIRNLSSEYQDGKTHDLIEHSLEKWSSKRRFCTTSKGRLACVPTAAQKGDLICVIYGGEVPYVLRPQKRGYYFVVGECYVDGIMHGEALSSESFRAKRFKLV